MKTQLLTIMINLERIEFLNKKINLNNKIGGRGYLTNLKKVKVKRIVTMKLVISQYKQ